LISFFLGIQMPGRDGFEVIEQVGADKMACDRLRDGA
jgi:hypothetical protein